MFWNKSNKMNSEEFEKVLKRIVDIESKLAALIAKNDALETNITSLRNSVNRKKKIDTEEQTQDFNTLTGLYGDGNI